MYKLSKKIMQMDDVTWARHANPWSVYTRFTILPLLALSIWSRWWLGWDALFLLILTVLWTWLNPRLFPPPKSTDNWASKGVIGEQLFLQRQTIPLPTRRIKNAHILTGISVVSMLVMMYGLWHFDLLITIIGLLATMAAKAAFLHQMVLLYEEIKDP